MTKDTMTTKRLTIMRGLPGSGKSYFARSIADGAPIFSTDDFFVVDGEYKFDGSKLGQYHAANLARSVKAMSEGVPHIIIDNTCTQAWEAREYVKAALQHGYGVRFIELMMPWSFDVAECARRNQHGVPEAAIAGMLARWEKDLTVASCLAAKAPWE
jgi:predicted kinase